MKLVLRADDIGYTKLYNANFDVFYNGFATSADVMADTPGSVEAMEKLRDLPWISVGWHTHMWGSPVLAPEKVPSLYDADTGHFKKDVALLPDVSFDEALAELRAQMSLFHTHMGKAPDTIQMLHGGTPFGDAMLQVCHENGIVMNYASSDSWWQGQHMLVEAEEPWKARNIWMFNDPETMTGIFTDSIQEQYTKYDPVDYFLHRSKALFELPEGATAIQAWHPGIVDYYVEKLGDYGQLAPNFLLVRPLDMHALMSGEVRDWLIANRVELVNQRDALYGTREYQNHLREIGSPLYMG